MFVVDTNVLVYAADPDSEFHPVCRDRLRIWRGQAAPWYVTWSICYEFLRLCTHARVFRRPWTAVQGWEFLGTLLDSPVATMLLATARHGDLLREVIAEVPHLRGNILHDVHTAVLMREHGIRDIYTRDTDFSRFRFLRVIDPLD
jgi:toxin-antitoxin system PIN domain toxin